MNEDSINFDRECEVNFISSPEGPGQGYETRKLAAKFCYFTGLAVYLMICIRASLMNSREVFFQHSNERPHTRKVTLNEFRSLLHPAYSPDIAPRDNN